MSTTKIFWLSRRSDGKCMLTKLKPTLARRYGTRSEELYVPIGEPIAVQNLCVEGTVALFGVLPEPLQSIRVALTGKVLGESS